MAKGAAPKKPPDAPPAPPGKFAQFMQSSSPLYIGVGLSIIFFIVAVTLSILNFREWKKRNIFAAGVKKISENMEIISPNLVGQSDLEKIKAAERMCFVISAENRKNAELKHEIDDIKYRLKVEWVNFRGSIYLFDNLAHARRWEDCLRYCAKKPYTGSLCIESDEEAKFTAGKIRKAPTDYWTAIHMVDSRWECAVDNKPVPAEYWDTARKQPNNKGPATQLSENCVIITRNCQQDQNCWHDLTCRERKRCICKMKPNKKWMT